MSDLSAALGATKSASTLFVLFVPSQDRFGRQIDQQFWVRESLATLGKLFGGATAFPQGRGVWRDDAQGGKLLFDSPVVIQCYTSDAHLNEHANELRAFLHRMGKEARQGAVGFVIDRDYLEIEFSLEETGHGSKRPRTRRSPRRPRRQPDS